MERAARLDALLGRGDLDVDAVRLDAALRVEVEQAQGAVDRGAGVAREACVDLGRDAAGHEVEHARADGDGEPVRDRRVGAGRLGRGRGRERLALGKVRILREGERPEHERRVGRDVLRREAPDQRRLARVDDSANILKAIRLDFEELGQRQAQLERALTEVETDSDGKTLADRQNVLNEFVLQSRQRLGALQETLTTLNAFKAELSKSQADLVPLKAPVFGIEAMIADVSVTRDLLAKTVAEIEASGDATLTSRIDALTKSKREVEDRLARIFENFNALDALRKDIGGIFSTIRNSLNRIG